MTLMGMQPFKLERYFAENILLAPYFLGSSDCQSVTVGELLALEEGSAESLRGLWLGYTDPRGGGALREEISKLYDTMEAGDVLVHSGSEEAIFIFMNAVLERGDHVIVHYPCYQSLFVLAESLGCESTPWVTREESDWELDVSVLKKIARPNTRVLVINCPHNPTGYVVGGEALAEIVEFCRDRNITILSDEVYRLLEYREEDRLPAVCDIYDRGVSLGSMSKSFGLAGLRIGWAATRDQTVRGRMACFKDYTTICASASSEFLATLSLRNRQILLERNRRIIRENLALLRDFSRRHSDNFRLKPPAAGPTAFPSLLGPVPPETFCADLASKKGVLLLPGTVYGPEYKNFRIGFGRANFPQCLEKLEAYWSGAEGS